MILRHSPTSPFVRKVMVLLHEKGMVDRVTIDAVDGWSEPAVLTAENPLSMVPTLLLDDGQVLYDSAVICDYLDSQYGGPAMIPDGQDRWQVMCDQALADGMLDCAVLIFLELGKRPQAKQWNWWLTLKRHAIERSLDQLEACTDKLTPRVDLGTVSIAVALAYLDLRNVVGDWRAPRPGLSKWHANFAARSSMVATAPVA